MQIVGRVSTWIEPDSEDEALSRDSEAALRQELDWASHLSLQACILQLPAAPSSANFAHVINQVQTPTVQLMRICNLHALLIKYPGQPLYAFCNTKVLLNHYIVAKFSKVCRYKRCCVHR